MQTKIVSLTPNFAVASQIGADDIAEIAAAGYRTLINNRPDGEQEGQLSSQEAKRKAEAAGMDYHYLPITAATLTTAQVEEFERLLAGLEGPILAHCRSGTRCCLLWSIAELRKGADNAEALIQRGAEQGFSIPELSRFAPS
jgi:uncharacterized protein (TIGR01244 family)